MELHAAGQLVPALRVALERPVPLPAAVSTAQAAAAAAAVALAGAVAAWLLVWRRPAPTYLLDFECYRPGGWRRCCGGVAWVWPGCGCRGARQAVEAGSPPTQLPAAALLACCRPAACGCCVWGHPAPPPAPSRSG